MKKINIINHSNFGSIKLFSLRFLEAMMHFITGIVMLLSFGNISIVSLWLVIEIIKVESELEQKNTKR
jgi:hypothetical protein